MRRILRFARRLNVARKDQKGFTLIELLVVVIIIGILAAIAIPTFLSQQRQAYNADAQSTARNATTAAIGYFADNQTYAGISAVALEEYEPSLPDAENAAPYGNPGTYTVTETEGSDDFQIDVRHFGGDITYRATNAGVTEL